MANPLQPIVQSPPPSTSGANTYTDVNALAALKKDPSSPAAIKAVAQQVDALFLQMMLKSMRDAGADVGEPTSNEMGMYQDMFDKQISLQLSQHQSLGLGAQLTRQLQAQAAAKAAQAAADGAANSASTPTTQLPAVAQPAGKPLSRPPIAPGSPATSGAIATSPTHFVSQIFPAIKRAATALGVSPLGMLAQAALETGWGQRMARTVAGSPSLNLFGIKADGNWGGTRATANTVEFSNGVASPRRTAFRAYDSIEASVNDFAGLLGSSPRYRDAVASGGSVDDYVAAMGKSGYATDPKYGDKLNEILNSSTFRDALKKGVISL